MSTFDDLKSYAKEVQAGLSSRDSMFKAVEDMYLMKAGDLPSANWIKETLSPDARNALLGAVRLLTAADPEWSMPHEDNDIEATKISESVENVCAQISKAVSRIKKKTYWYDAVLSALLYGEAHIAVATTKDMVDAAKPEDKTRMGNIAMVAPLMFDVLSPKISYPVFDVAGLTSHFTCREMMVMDVIARWGKEAASKMGDKSRYSKVVYNEFWDNTYHAVWVDGVDGALLMEEHKLPYIPIACQVIEGGDLFESVNETRQPFLYTLYKSNMWKRQNLALTVMYSLIYSVGANPMFVYKRAMPDKQLAIDWSNPGGYIAIDQGETFDALAKQVIDPAIQQGMQIAEQKVVESTIYRQTLGESLGNNATYSMTAALIDAGKLPLVPYQRAVSWLLGDAMSIGLKMLKKAGGNFGDYKFSNTPERFHLEGNLRVSMPKDDRQAIVTALQATGGDYPLVSNRYAREVFMEVGQSQKMQNEIWSEKAAQMKVQMMLQQWMQQQAQAQQPQMQQPGQVPPGQPPMQPQPGQEQGVPSELLAQMQGAGQQGGQMPPGLEQMIQGGAGGGLQQASAGMPMAEPQLPPGMGGMTGGD